MMKKFTGIFACALIVGVASFATAGVPDLGLSTASTASGPAQNPVMFNLPNGAGSAFTAAGIVGGTIDATITVTLLDGGSVPVANYPSEDLWLETEDLSQEYLWAACIGGTTADADTDVNGQTTWTTPLRAGGASESLTFVMVNGAALAGGLTLRHNSPDINGDGKVNLSDVPEFVGDYFGGTNPFRTDLQYDGNVNLSDVVKVSQGLGAECP
jgi:hypothetical protein